MSDSGYTIRIRSGMEAMAEALADFAARTQITYNEGLQAPIDEGQIVGTLTYTAPDGTVVSGMLSAERAMEARPEHATVYDVLPFLLPLETVLLQRLGLGGADRNPGADRDPPAPPRAQKGGAQPPAHRRLPRQAPRL